MAKTSKRQDRQRQNTLTPAKSESRRVGLLQEPHLQLAYTFFNARGKKQRTYQPLPSLANAPPSVIELVEKLYKAYKSTVGLFKSKQKKKHEANVRRYLQDSPENSLDHMLKVAFITTNDEEDEVVNRAQPYIPHTFVDTNLLRDALNVGEFKTCQRLARIGDLVQNLLLSELIYEGTDLTSGFAEQQLKQIVGQNDYQAKQMLKNDLWRCVFQRRTDIWKLPKKTKLPADILEAVLGAVYLDARTVPHWRIER